MTHEMLNRFDAHALLVKRSAKAASTTVTARLDTCALVDRFQPGAERHIAEVTSSASAANERSAVV